MCRRRRQAAWRQSPICGDAVDVIQQKGPSGPRSARDVPHERSELMFSGTLWRFLSLLILSVSIFGGVFASDACGDRWSQECDWRNSG